MNNLSSTLSSVKPNDEVNLGKVKSSLVKGKFIVLASTVLFALCSAILALRMPNMYLSEVVLIPSGERTAPKLSGQLSGLAALAGMNLGGSGDKSALAVEILKSKEFQANFIEKENLKESIFAAKGWDRASNTLIYDEDVYNANLKKWVRIAEAPYNAEPSRLELVNEFNRYFNVNVEKTTGIIKISMKHYSPFVAKHILDSIVVEINENIRNRDLNESKLSIEFIEHEIAQTNLSDLKSMLFSLVEEQTKNIMIANTRKEYVFKIIDPAVAPEQKSEPKRAVIVFSGAIIGFLTGFLVSLRRYYNS